MTGSKGNALRSIGLFVLGVVLNVMILAFFSMILLNHLQARQYFFEASRSPAASEALRRAFDVKDAWMDFVAIPIIGCLIGAYAGLLQRGRPVLLAIGCLLPTFLYEIATEPIHAWSSLADLRYFGTRTLEFLLAVVFALCFHAVRERQRRHPTTARAYPGN